MDGSQRELPQSARLLTSNDISEVYLDQSDGHGTIYKRSIPFLIENELYCLTALRKYTLMDRFGLNRHIVPSVTRYDKYTLRMNYIRNGTVEHVSSFKGHLIKTLHFLKLAGIRHGDLTSQAILVDYGDMPVLIDFAESRLVGDPRPDKRPEGDEYWMWRAYDEIVSKIKQP